MTLASADEMPSPDESFEKISEILISSFWIRLSQS